MTLPTYSVPNEDDEDDAQSPANPAANPAAPKLPRPDDNALAKRWLFNNPRVKWGMGEWRKYKDGIWIKTDSDSIKNNIKKIIEAAASEGVRCTANLVGSVAELARLEVSIPAETWDAHPLLLPCQNGVLDIPSRTLLPHTPDIYATSQLPFDFDPTADCPAFKQALQQIPESIDFLQEFAGYSLTPDTKHEIAIWLYGEPGTGKSTILEGLKAMLGTRAGILGLADIERSKFALSNLPGKTLVWSAEQPDSFISLSYILNQIISGETVAKQPNVNVRPASRSHHVGLRHNFHMLVDHCEIIAPHCQCIRVVNVNYCQVIPTRNHAVILPVAKQPITDLVLSR